MSYYNLQEEFQKIAQTTTDEAVELVLASRGENVYAIRELRPFIITPQFVGLLALQIQVQLHEASKNRNLKAPEQFDDLSRITGFVHDIARDCLGRNSKIRPIFLPE